METMMRSFGGNLWILEFIFFFLFFFFGEEMVFWNSYLNLECTVRVSSPEYDGRAHAGNGAVRLFIIRSAPWILICWCLEQILKSSRPQQDFYEWTFTKWCYLDVFLSHWFCFIGHGNSHMQDGRDKAFPWRHLLKSPPNYPGTLANCV